MQNFKQGLCILVQAYSMDQKFSQITTGCDITNPMKHSYSLETNSSSASREILHIFET